MTNPARISPFAAFCLQMATFCCAALQTLVWFHLWGRCHYWDTVSTPSFLRFRVSITNGKSAGFPPDLKNLEKWQKQSRPGKPRKRHDMTQNCMGKIVPNFSKRQPIFVCQPTIVLQPGRGRLSAARNEGRLVSCFWLCIYRSLWIYQPESTDTFEVPNKKKLEFCFQPGNRAKTEKPEAEIYF